MANGWNQVTLFGNLGADPELRHTNAGGAVLRFRIATTESYLDRNRVRQERTEWHSVVVWGKRAEALARLLSRGAKVFVTGSLRTSSWEDDTGKKNYRTDVVAREVLFGSPAQGRGGGPRDYEPPSEDAYEDEIPF